MARRNANGMGGRPRKVEKNGSVYWRSYYTDPITGKQRDIYARTEAECTAKLMDALTAIHQGTYTAPSKLTVEKWLRTWLDEYCTGITDGTRRSYENAVTKHAIPAIGRIRLTDLRPQDYQRFVNGLSKDKGLSSKTVANITGAIHKGLAQAVKNGLIHRNPADAPDKPRIESKEKSPFTGEQIDSFLSAIKGNPFETLFFVTMYTGLRLGEVIGLRWKDLNLRDGIIHVRQQIRPDGSIDKPKHHKQRSFIMAQRVTQALREHRREQKVIDPNGLVFCYEGGKSLPHSTVEHNFKRIVKGMGMPERTFHDLRHTFCTQAIASGIDPKTVAAMAGHADAKLTLNVYTHTTDAMLKDAAERINSGIIAR